MTSIISIIGMMGSGKSLIGKRLASILDIRCFDLDTEIERTTQSEISAIFAQHGESFFRDVESTLLAQRLADPSQSLILACGGGIILRKANRDLLRSRSFVVWLDVPADELYRRLTTERSNRPLLAQGDLVSRINKLSLERQPLYAETAHYHLMWQEGLTADECALLIRDQWFAQVKQNIGRD